MASGRKRRPGFTLTEMLMAAGILGIGLTMVASIFPVAVDQSRRSRDQTMAALCARSVMARVRADRNKIYDWLRIQTAAFRDLNADAGALFPGKHIVYKPSTFLYTKSRTYGEIDKAQTWEAGNYVARLFASRTSTDGPWRIAIFVCRSIGHPTIDLDFTVARQQWVNADKPIPGPGTYVVERSRACAWGYPLDYVTIDPSTLDKTGYPAVGCMSGGSTTIIPASTSVLRVPDAVAVFHTILGE